MKQRLLVKLLNDTRYNVGDYTDYIAVGSQLCHDLIKVDKKTLQLSYALNFNGKYLTGVDRVESDKKELRNGRDELLFIYETLERLIDSGEIKDIIEGCDELENKIPIYTIKEDYKTGEVKLIKTYTDFLSWPDVKDDEHINRLKTICGQQMYINTHFLTAKEAIDYGIKEQESIIKILDEQIKEKMEQITDKKLKILQCKINIKNIQNEPIQ